MKASSFHLMVARRSKIEACWFEPNTEPGVSILALDERLGRGGTWKLAKSIRTITAVVENERSEAAKHSTVTLKNRD